MTVAAYIGAPLESGDRLTREEFHRRYEARPDIKRAELVNGVVYLPSPTRFTFHDEPAALVIAWLVAYAAKHPEVRTGGSATLYLDGSSEVQPDAFAFSEVLPATWRERRTSSSRWRPAASHTTSTTRKRCTAVTGYSNTSCGGCWMD
jgi:hypothetical protein